MIFSKWKEEWLKRNNDKLYKEYESKLNQLKESFDLVVSEWQSKIESSSIELEKKHKLVQFKQTDIDELSKRLDERKLALEQENEELKMKLKLIEAKSSPSNIWAEAFTCGFSKAWDMMNLSHEGIDRVKKIIEDKAINDTLRRMNGNNKKTN